MKQVLTLLSFALMALMLSSCVTPQSYRAKAYAPTNKKNVRVKVSLQNKMVYVLEGDRALMVTPCTIGTQSDPTPQGNFKIFKKIEKKRSYSYGFQKGADYIRPAKSSDRRPGESYHGFPMPYWAEFHPAYGFHEGGVWPEPRSHGCLRLHKTAAPKFFHLVQLGTPVSIAQTQPEDATVGRSVARPTDYADPDPPAIEQISPAIFKPTPHPLFEAGPAPTIN
ncbi:MAG: hypothetical protein ACI8UO_004881 [Verrucomicrobiales bacterium]|jgi:hypothetical protein